TRAEITPTRFVNVYHYGDFRGNSDRLIEKYYDAHLYLANWGTRRLLFRVPGRLIDGALARQYCVGEGARLRTHGEHVILDFHSDLEEGGEWEEGEGWLDALVPVRAELLAGDLRGLYLAWLNGIELDDLDEDKVEPPVPPGLGKLSPALKKFAEFLRIDEDL